MNAEIGFVGLGAMGSRIAGRLLDAGHHVYGTNRTPAKAQPLIDLAREAANELAIPLPSAAAADKMLTRADELGYAHRDLAALHEVLARTPAGFDQLATAVAR